MFFELLTGRKPFEGATETIAYKICHEPHQDPSAASPDRVPVIFDRVVAKALTKKPEMRYQSAREFAEAILKAYEKRVDGMEDTVLNTGLYSPSGRTETTFPPAGWNAEELKPLEELLMPHVGPMARILVKKAAALTTDTAQLVNALAENISDEDERKAFLSAARTKAAGMTNPGGSGGGTRTSMRPGGQTATHMSRPPMQAGTDSGTRTSSSTRFGKSFLDPADIEKAAARLMPYVGPIAPVLAKKAAAGLSSRTALLLALAEHIPDEDDKAAFLSVLAKKK